MGGALAQGWLKGDICSNITILDPFDVSKSLQNEPIVNHVKTLDEISSMDFDCILLATKPQIMDEVCAVLAPSITAKPLVLSIAAGKSIGYFENYFGSTHPIIRTMPNTPAAIGKGITVACPNAAVTFKHKQTADLLLQAAGMVEWLVVESLLDAVTAVSGSGPAYVFHLIEILEKSALDLGLPHDLAAKLARQTVIGSAALAEADNQTPASTLRENVTSPGGTTAAALNVLMDGRLQKIYKEALTAARNRGKELG